MNGKNSSKKAGVAIGAIVVVAVIAGLVIWMSRGEAEAPAESRLAQDAVSAAAESGDYASVSRALDRGDLEKEEVRQAVRDEFEKQTKQRIRDYFAAADDAQRRAVLDKAIDDLERFRAEARSGADDSADDEAEASRSPQDNAALRVAAWALSQPPDERAKLAEFHVAMEQRRKERGLPSVFGSGPLPLGHE